MIRRFTYYSTNVYSRILDRTIAPKKLKRVQVQLVLVFSFSIFGAAPKIIVNIKYIIYIFIVFYTNLLFRSFDERISNRSINRNNDDGNNSKETGGDGDAFGKER